MLEGDDTHRVEGMLDIMETVVLGFCLLSVTHSTHPRSSPSGHPVLLSSPLHRSSFDPPFARKRPISVEHTAQTRFPEPLLLNTYQELP